MKLEGSAYRINVREPGEGIRRSRAWDRLRGSPPLRRLAFDAVVAAPSLVITASVVLSHPYSIAAGIAIALLMYAVLVIVGVAPIGALYDKMDPKVAMKISILICVYSPLSLFLLVGHWTLTGEWLPARWLKESAPNAG